MDLLNQIFEAGVVGAGGAGFPTHMKLTAQVEYLMINAAECEPLLNTDKYIMRHFPAEIVEATRAVSQLVSARETFIAVKRVNQNEIAALQKAIDDARVPIKIFPLDNYYPAGDEQMIVYDITGRTVPPGGIPLAVGAVVSNVATILNIYDAIQGRPVTHKFLTVTGEVNRPQVLRVPIGISFRACVEACGGSKLTTYNIINGGPMMGKVSSHKELDSLFVTKTTSGIILAPEDGNFVGRQKETSVRQILNRAKSACIQCSFCTDLCPRNLIGHSLRPNRIMRHMAAQDFDKGFDGDDQILKEALICCECGVCETYACPMGLSPRQVNIFVKKQLAGARYTSPTHTFTASSTRDYKKIVPKKIMARMGLARLYDCKADAFTDFSANRVSIALKQHIGMAAVPCVGQGETVTAGTRIASGEFDKVSANIHASITGTVTKITGDAIEIKGGVV